LRTRIAVLALLAAISGCSIGAHSSSPPPAVGDACLVGTWTLQSEQNKSGYSFNSESLAVAGLAGATLTITSAGEEKENFDSSQPLEGTLADGRRLRITIRGSFDFHIKAGGGKYTETGSATDLPTTATVDGQPVNYHSSYAPGHGTYTCAGGSLTMTTGDGNQTDLWSKG
jgi:hypothetical protein